MRSTSLYILLFSLVSLTTKAQLLELRFLEAEVEQSLEYTTGKKDLTMFYHLNEFGFKEGPFRIEQSFEFNPGYKTIRVKGNFHYGVLKDSLFVYNDRAQIVEKGFFKSIGDGKYDSLSGFYRGIGLIGIREGKFTYYNSGNGYKDYKLEKTVEFKNGYKDGKEVFYYPDGLDYQLKSWKKDTLHGLSLTKFSTGNPFQEINYNIGKKDGPRVTYYPNGKVKDSIYYFNGSIVGESYYYSNGQFKVRFKFDRQELIYESPKYDSLGNKLPSNHPMEYATFTHKVETITNNMWPNFQMPEEIPNYYGYYIKKKEYRFLKRFKNNEIQVEFKNDTISSLEIISKPKKTKKIKKAESQIISILNRELGLIHLKSENGLFMFQITNLIKKSPMEFE